ncbi:MAG: hypothetical protein AAGE52_15070 [Myxococcota bacterium]
MMVVRLVMVVSLLTACGARTGLPLPQTSEEDAGLDATITFDVGVDAFDAGVDAPFDAGVDAPDVWIPECPDSVAVSAREASVPVDIIWALDSSLSMVDDAERMRDNIEIFWESITEANVDARVIFLSERGYAPGAPGGYSRRYFEIPREVDSWNALAEMSAAWRDYSRYLRADAITHFIVVSDDDSLAMEWEDFQAGMRELLGRDFFFHAVASERVMPTPSNPRGVCSTPTSSAFRPGYEYIELTDATGGLFLSICNEDWSELFTLLSERIAIRIPLPCGYTLPLPPPAGVEYIPDRFTLLWQLPDEAGPRVIPRAGEGEDDCGDGWWYFDGSDRVQLCPSTCEEVEALGGRVEIDLGCDPVEFE